MFNRHDKEREYAHRLADDLKRRLLTSTILGVLTVFTTGISAAFGYYTRELPASIKSLTTSVENLRVLIENEAETNDEQAAAQQTLDKRVTRLELWKDGRR